MNSMSMRQPYTDENYRTFEIHKIYDVIIIGGGPAGLTAAVYCMRKGLVTGLIAQNIGGQMAETAGIENYLGFRYINGFELVEKFHDQVLQFGIALALGVDVIAIKDAVIKEVFLEDGRKFFAKSLIVASGKEGKKLGVPGEKELTGHGVSYCPICDAPFFKGKNVGVVGGGNSAVEAIIDLAKQARHITVVQNLDHFTCDKILLDKVSGFTNVDFLYEHVVEAVVGMDQVKGAIVRNLRTHERKEINLDGLFIQIGLVPHSLFAKGILAMNAFDEIVVDCHCRTNLPGIYAAGDVTSVPFKQIIIACGEGAKAALSASEYIDAHRW